LEFQIDTDEKLRILESKYSLMRDRMLMINQNMIDQYKKINSEMKLINDDIKEIKMNLNNMKETNMHIIKELQGFARKENLKVLEKYINFWNPLNFTTEEEVIKLIEERGVKNSTRKPRTKKQEK